VALLEKAAGQGHAYAMDTLGGIFYRWKEPEQSVGWTKKAGAYTRPHFSST